MTSSGVNQHVDVRQWELILWISFIEVSEVDVALYLTICLLHLDNVNQPSWVLYGFNETDVEELLDLPLDLDLQLWPEMSKRLFDKLNSLFDVELPVTSLESRPGVLLRSRRIRLGTLTKALEPVFQLLGQACSQEYGSRLLLLVCEVHLD